VATHTHGGLFLECRGVVQGVGFRPAVHRLARQLGLGGTLHNAPGLVRLTLTGERSALERFLAELPGALPPGARLEPLVPHWLAEDAATAAAVGSAPPAGTAGSSAPSLTISAGPEQVAAPLAIGLIAPSLAADRAPCAACLRELDDPRSRRHGDPFLSCCDCGPRYAIATAEPWRRAHTTLAAFVPCAACAAEFADPTDRRFHSETISCPVCGPRLALLPPPASPSSRSREVPPAALQPSARSSPLELPTLGPSAPHPPGLSAAAHHAALIDAAAALLERGQILALQGVGGFQLLVDATNRAAVARLRRRKRRPAKPLALLVGDPAWIAPHVHLAAEALALLRSPAAPIVLLPRRPWAEGAPAGSAIQRDSPQACRGDAGRAEGHRPGSQRGLAHRSAPHPAGFPPGDRGPDPFPGVAPGSAQLGVLLPASPLHGLLARRFGRPLVCTSGNRSGEPLCTDPAEALERLAGIADAFLVHDRPIARPLDDSVVQLIEAQPALLRRARGYAPEPLELPLPLELPAAAGPRSFAEHPVPLGAGRTLAVADHRLKPTRGELDHAERMVPELGAPADAPSRFSLDNPSPSPSPSPSAPSSTPSTKPSSGASSGAALALGGDLKAAPALAMEGRVWLAPHLGDLGERRCYERFRAGIAELVERHGHQLERIAIDRHPGYLSHQLGQAMAQDPPILQVVQHHAAHALAVVAEHGLVAPLLAFCADGLGYGDDPLAVGVPSGGIQARGPSPPLWGGELLAIDTDPRADRIERLACLRPLPLPGGDRAAREPRRVALGLLAAAGPGFLEHPGAARSRRAFRAAEREVLLAMVERGVNCPWSSSLGRLFDGAASLLGLSQRMSHEGEAGLRLQGLAALAAGSRSDRWVSDPGNTGPDAALDGLSSHALERTYPFPLVPAAAGDGPSLPLGWLDWQPLLEALLADRAAGESAARCALRFHGAVAEGVAHLLERAAGGRGCRTVVLAGGCFQNALLLEDLLARLRRRGLDPHIARAVPGNDGGLALGQLWACAFTGPTPDPQRR